MIRALRGYRSISPSGGALNTSETTPHPPTDWSQCGSSGVDRSGRRSGTARRFGKRTKHGPHRKEATDPEDLIPTWRLQVEVFGTSKRFFVFLASCGSRSQAGVGKKDPKGGIASLKEGEEEEEDEEEEEV